MFNIIHGSCAEQNVDVVVNAANDCLLAGGGICGAIFSKAGYDELEQECAKHQTPLNDGDAVITSSCNMKNAKAIIHAVGPDFRVTPNAVSALFDAYYNSLRALKENGFHSISFPLISAGIFAGNMVNPAGESAKQCFSAYDKFVEDNPDYEIEVLLCAYSMKELIEVKSGISKIAKYKIPGRKGYASEEEYRKWTDSIPDDD